MTSVRLNPFVVIGSARSGTGLLRSSIDSHPSATCLGELLHADNEKVRRANHIRYFDDKDWLKLGSEIADKKAAIQYLERKIWPEAESDFAFGFKLLFWQIEYFQLWSYLSEKVREKYPEMETKKGALMMLSEDDS